MKQNSCAMHALQECAPHRWGSRSAHPCLTAHARSNAMHPHGAAQVRRAVCGCGSRGGAAAPPPAGPPGRAQPLRGSQRRSPTRAARSQVRAHSFVPPSTNPGTLSVTTRAGERRCVEQRQSSPNNVGISERLSSFMELGIAIRGLEGKTRRSPGAGCECSWLQGRKEVIRSIHGA